MERYGGISTRTRIIEYDSCVLYTEFGFDDVGYSGLPENEKCYGDLPRIGKLDTNPNSVSSVKARNKSDSGFSVSRGVTFDTGFEDTDCLSAIGGDFTDSQSANLSDFK